MKITVLKPTEIDVDAIRCVLAVRYTDEDMPFDYPHRKGDTWAVTIDINTGQIHDWPKGVEPLDLYMKVCDEGSYYLLSGDTIVAKREGDYVPDCVPGAYGDYVEFKIDENGFICNWEATASDIASSFFSQEED